MAAAARHIEFSCPLTCSVCIFNEENSSEKQHKNNFADCFHKSYLQLF